MENVPFDVEINQILENTYKAALLMGEDYTPEQIKLMIIATNLQSLARTFLLADEKPEEVKLNLKQVALGILGTCDFVKNGLPYPE